MTHYLLSVHTGGTPAAPSGQPEQSEQEQHESHQRLGQIEDELRRSGAWVFSGRLTDPEAATVVRVSGEDVLTTDGPYAESKEHLAGFYVVDLLDQEAALALAAKVTSAIGPPIEVRPFAGVQLD